MPEELMRLIREMALNKPTCANAFKFGLRAGNGSALTSPDSIIGRND
jgi:hypothetical protein